MQVEEEEEESLLSKAHTRERERERGRRQKKKKKIARDACRTWTEISYMSSVISSLARSGGKVISISPPTFAPTESVTMSTSR